MGSTFFSLLSLLVLIPGLFAGLDWKHEFNGYQYAAVEKAVTWYEGSYKCMAEGGHLASIESLEENQFIENIIKPGKENFWIGMNNLANRDKWVWSDGKPVSYFVWGGSLLQRFENCGYFSKGLWYSDLCLKLKGFLCERKKIVSSAKLGYLPATTYSVCPQGWEDGGTNRCYKIYDSTFPLTWASAKRNCLFITEFNGDLASAREQSEINTLHKMLSMRISPLHEHQTGSRFWHQFSPPKSIEKKTKSDYNHPQEGCKFIFNDPTGIFNMYTSQCYGKYRGYICQVRKIQPRISQLVLSKSREMDADIEKNNNTTSEASTMTTTPEDITTTAPTTTAPPTTAPPTTAPPTTAPPTTAPPTTTHETTTTAKETTTHEESTTTAKETTTEVTTTMTTTHSEPPTTAGMTTTSEATSTPTSMSTHSVTMETTTEYSSAPGLSCTTGLVTLLVTVITLINSR